MSKKQENTTKHAIDSIYQIEEKKTNIGLIVGISLTVVLVLVLIILGAISMKNGAGSAASDASETYNVSILGTFDAKSVSLPLLSIVLGLVDGFNPCAMWILVFLILMLIEMKDRKKMWILGSAFLLTSALIYLIFMVSWLNVAMILTGIKFVRYAIGVFAFVFGSVNVYRFIKLLNEDVGCDVTDEKKRNKIMTSIKKIVSEKSFIISLIGIIALAAGVNLIELLCSLGIPVVFTQVLALNNLNVAQYMIYIILYLIFFMIDDFIVFLIAMTTFKVTGISNKYTKYSHLFGGIFMVILGILMIFKPAWIMFNFNDDVKVVEEVSYGDFTRNATLDDIQFNDKVNVYLFWGNGCPHCADLYKLLNEYRNNEYGTKFNLYGFEVWNNKENSNLMLEVADVVGNRSEVTGVPYLIIGDNTMVGYADYNASKVKEMLDTAINTESNKRNDYMKTYLDLKANESTTTSSTTTVVKTTKKK